MAKYQIKDIWSGKDDIPTEQFFQVSVRYPRKNFGEAVADEIVRYIKKNKLDKNPGYALVMIDGDCRIYLENKTDPKFLSTKSETEKSVKAIAEYICEVLTKYAEMYKGLSWCSFSVTSKDGVRFLAQIERVEDKSESNKSSTTRVGKILESLNKRKTVNEARSDYKIVYYDGRGEKGTEYYSYMERDEFKADAKNIKKNYPYGAGAYVLKGQDWKLVAGEDVLNNK